MIRFRLLPSLAALVFLSVACFAGCGGGTCDSPTSGDACTACDDAQAACMKACTTQACTDACRTTHNDCSAANCHYCG
jgi:hypothetical protein